MNSMNYIEKHYGLVTIQTNNSKPILACRYTIVAVRSHFRTL